MLKEEQSQHCCILCVSSRGFPRLVDTDRECVRSGCRSNRPGLIFKKDWCTAGCRRSPPQTCHLQGQETPGSRSPELASAGGPAALRAYVSVSSYTHSPCLGPRENKPHLRAAISHLPLLWLALPFELASQGTSRPGREQYLW